MLAHSHIVFGIVVLAAASVTPIVDINPLTAGAAALGALLPDIDHPHSAIGRRLRPLSDIIGLIFGHRGLTHSLAAAVAAIAAAVWLGLAGHGVLAALALGYLSHLFGDWLTPSGVPLLWPSARLYRAPYRYRIRTGGLGEFLFVAALLVAVLGLASLVS